jgi:hypothetical protein
MLHRLVPRDEPESYWDIIKWDNPRKGRQMLEPMPAASPDTTYRRTWVNGISHLMNGSRNRVAQSLNRHWKSHVAIPATEVAHSRARRIGL